MPSPLEIQRNAVKLLWQQNVRNANEISQQLRIPLRSCVQYVSILNKIGNLSINHSPGRPRKLSPKKRRHIGKILKHNHFTTASELKNKLEMNDSTLEVSERTIRRELKNLGYISILPRKVPLLTKRAKDVRLSWARDHLRYNWKKVVFSDETKVEKKIKNLVAKNKKISQEIFLTTIMQEWNDLDNSVLLQCIKSMPNQIQACIDAEGGHTKY